MYMIVYEKSKESEELEGMGTTLDICLIYNNRAFIGHVGDSRIYIIRDDEILPVNREHNYGFRLHEMLNAGTITEEEYLSEEERAEALISFLGVGKLELMDINEEPFPLNDNCFVK